MDNVLYKKKCPKCGTIHEISATMCEKCGAEINVAILEVTKVSEFDYESDKSEQGKVSFMVQKCPGCETLYCTDDIMHRAKRCDICGRGDIRMLAPMDYIAFFEKAREKSVASEANTSSDNSESVVDIPQDDSTGNIGNKELMNAVGRADEAIRRNDPKLSVEEDCSADKSEELACNNEPAAKQDDRWGFIGSKTSVERITFTKEGSNKRCTIVVPKEGDKFIIGRDAHLKDMLDNDLRVGNEHCYIHRTNGLIQVTDNHSINGTVVNDTWIGKDGTQSIKDGDRLRLGRNPNSVTLIISF